MRQRKKIRIIFEDESRLEKILQFRWSVPKLILVAVSCVAVFLVAAMILVMVTPLHSLLPGYLKKSERAATEENLLRLDSLSDAFSRNAAFLANISNVLDTSRVPSDSTSRNTSTNDLTPDSLLSAGKEERRFVKMMQEREKYNISVVAPLAAEGMMFNPVSAESVISQETVRDTRAEVLLPRGNNIGCISDGRVIAVYPTPGAGGWSILVMHPKGFASRYSRCGTPLVEPGDAVMGSQVIALTDRGNGMAGEKIFLEMWHNGIPLIPAEYVEPTFPGNETAGLSAQTFH